MSPVLSSQSMVLATAMAVSGTVLLIALRLQKSPSNSSSSPSSTPHYPLILSHPLPPSCIVSPEKRRKKKEKRVHFAEDVVDPIGNGDLYRKKLQNSIENSRSSTLKTIGGKVKEMPENRVALYNGILRDRIFHRVAYSY